VGRRGRRRALKVATAVVALAGLGGGLAVAESVGMPAGPRPDGSAVTPAGFWVTPAGEQTPLGGLPLSAQLSPDGRTLLVSNDGQGTQSLQVVDTGTSTVTQTIPYSSPRALFVGLAFSPDGTTVYAGGGGEQVVHTYSVSAGKLTETRPIPVPSPPGTTVNMFPAGLAVTPDGSRLVVADHLADSVSVIDLATKAVATVAAGHNPWGVAVSPDGRTAYVSNQGDQTVSVVGLDTATPTVRGKIPVGQHPNAVLLDPHGQQLFVASAQSDQVDVVDTAGGAVSSTIDLSPYRRANVGTSPVALSLAPDGQRLFVANAGNNDVAVVDLSRGRMAGLVPTAWYPTAVVATSDRLFVVNGKGLGAGPNSGPGHPDPTWPAPTAQDQYVGSMMTGSLSTVPLPLSNGQLQRYTAQVAVNDGFDQEHGVGPRSPTIDHVIYVVQENRTFDQEFGSLGKGNGDPQLNLFGDETAPNSRDLQRRFTTLDNFYADAEISAQGWDWTTQADSNLYNESLWPANYSGRRAPYPSESADPAHAANRDPADSYVWDRLADQGISFRNYGFYVDEQPDHTFTATDPRLDAHTDHAFRGYDLACPDNPDTFVPLKSTCGRPRISEWLTEFGTYEASGTLPTVEFVRLPNDHTAGTKPGSPTPRAYVADNDLALGRLVDAVSHSTFWDSTAIFVTEDDAQNGPDHVDAHRTISQVISPYTQTGTVDSTFYSTASMLRSIENIVGIAPLTQFDAFATPMSASFAPQPDVRAYTAVHPQQAGNFLNGQGAPMAAQAAAQPLAQEDEIDEQTFNQEIWQSVRGANSPMPAPAGRTVTPGSSGRKED
jgi:YVTN family beta-propeller protein